MGPATVGAGLAGMAVDSLAGATIQAQYRTEAHGPIAERPPDPEVPPARGWAGVDNDAVNVLGSLGGAVVSILFWTI
jgi:uncharacterized membrane protein